MNNGTNIFYSQGLNLYRFSNASGGRHRKFVRSRSEDVNQW